MARKTKRPPWWFAPALWAGLAASAAMIAAVATTGS